MNFAELQLSTIPDRIRPSPPAPLLPVAVGMMMGIIADELWFLPLWACLLLVLVGGLVFEFRERIGKRFGALGSLLGIVSGKVTNDEGPAGIPIPHSARLRTGAPLIGVALLGIGLAAAGLGSLRHAIADRWLPVNHIGFYTKEEPVLVQIKGQVLTPPTISELAPEVAPSYAAQPTTRFILGLSELQGTSGPLSVSGLVSVVVHDAVLTLRPGEQIRMTGWLHRPPRPQNPGSYDWALHQHRAGIHAGFSCEHAESVVRVPPASGGGWAGLLNRVRLRLYGLLLDSAFAEKDPGAGIIAAMVLGARSAVPQAMNEVFVRTGNAHYLAASGMNVAWLALVGWGLLRLLGVYYRTASLVVASLMVSYVVVAEPQPSILRAGIVGVTLCLTIYFRGLYSATNALSLSAIIVLLMDPMDIFRPAFQYSFLAVLALLHLYPHLLRTMAAGFLRINLPRVARMFDRTIEGSLVDVGELLPRSAIKQIGGRVLSACGQMLVLSLSAWGVTAPLSCYYFNNFTPLGWLQTMLLWFTAMPVSVIGYVNLVVGLLFPSSGQVLGPILRYGTELMIAEVHLLARLPGTLIDGRSPSLTWVVACYAVLWLWVYRRHWLPWRYGFTVLFAILLLWWAVPPRMVKSDRGALRCWALSVGNGTANVIEMPDHRVYLCDFGTRSTIDAGKVGMEFLRYRGIDQIDTVLVSHPNVDHFSGILTLARQIPVRRIVVNECFAELARGDSSAQRFLAEIRKQGMTLEEVQGGYLGEHRGATVEMLWPTVAQRNLKDANESSTVLRVAYQGRSILLPGDIGPLAKGALLGGSLSDGLSGYPAEAPQADVLLLPHHGGVDELTARFIESVNPTNVIRSTGEPRRMTTNGIERLARGRRYFSTADNGCIVATIRDGEVSVAPAMPGFRMKL